MTRRQAFRFGLALGLLACTPVQPTLQPVPKPRYSYTPTGSCSPAGSSRLTLAIVAPRWQGANATPSGGTMGQTYRTPQDRFFPDLSAAMRADFLQLVTCRGYLAKGPFDSFEAMVYPDRVGSELLLEPELLIKVDIGEVSAVEPDFLTALASSGQKKIRASASVGGRVNLNLKEPVTNTRMWARSINVASESFTFDSERLYPTARMTDDQARAVLLSDEGLARALSPKLEVMYGSVFTAADQYLNRQELSSVASQAVDVRKRAAIRVPPQ